jgi:hypothetical protein
MARIRTIKPEFFTSEDIVSLTPFARLLYIALWCEADRDGRMAWKPRTFKMRYLPGDSVDIDALCNELTAAGLVRLYGDGLAFIPAFHAHQHINPRETASQFPEPTTKHASGTRQPRASDVQGGREGKGKEGNNDASRDASLFDKFWQAYPKKVGKDDARKAFDKRKPDDGLLAAMLSTLAVQVNTQQWTKDNGQFVPNPSTWLNQGRWQDEVTAGDDGGDTPEWMRGAI